MNIKDILTYFIGLVFIGAASHRIIYKKQRIEESETVFRLPKYFDIIIIIFEFIIGILLLINFKYKIELLKITLIFIIFASILIVIHNKNKLLNTYNEVFTYQPTFMSFTLHVTYIIIIFSIIFG
jgi:uncharacterized membrane protein YphA (DoxX/SURF4 family)